MAIKNSLDEKTVLIGFNGGLESTVVAYLLKKQGFSVIGVAVEFAPEEEEELKLSGDSFNDEKQSLQKNIFLGEYIVDDLEKIKSLASSLGISFYGVHAQDIYKAEVTDSLVASCLGGLWYEAKIDATNVLMRVLVEKADKLGAKWIATGHYAKVLKNYQTGHYNIFMGSEIEYDDSYYLATLDLKVLERLKLPLCEMRKVDVEKVGALTHFLQSNKKTAKHRLDIKKNPKLPMMVERYSPEKMKVEGIFYYHKEESMLGDHENYYQYYLGQDKLIARNGTALDKNLIVVETRPQIGHVVLAMKSEMKRRYIFLEKVMLAAGADVGRPTESLVKLGVNDDLLPVTLYMKNNQTCLLDLSKEVAGATFVGQRAVLYLKSGSSNKVLLFGIVKYSGFMENNKITYLPKTTSEIIEEEPDQKEERSIYDLKF